MFCVNQKGRTILELLAVIIVIAFLTMSAYRVFYYVSDSARVRSLEQEINMRVAQLQHQASLPKGIQTESISSALSRLNRASSGLPIQTVEVNLQHSTFTLQVGYDKAPMDYSLCIHLMNSKRFSPDNDANTACVEGRSYARFVFPFHKNLKKLPAAKYRPSS